MDSRFITEKNGQKVVLYAGLVHKAHEQGLVSILTDLVQIPGDGNGKVCIVHATVTLIQDGVTKTYQGYGDASPANVKSHMVTCIIRLAETRAKARALRDAIDVGMCCLEELSDYEETNEDAVIPAAQTRTMAAQGRPLRISASSDKVPNRTNKQCPVCNCPPGSNHATKCAEAAKQAA